MKVTLEGTVKVMNLFRALLGENYDRKVKWGEVADLIGTDNTRVCLLQRGKARLTNVEAFLKMSQATGVSIEEFILVATEQHPLPESLRYLDYVAEKRTRKANRRKGLKLVGGGR